jgi:putative transposase
VRAATRGCSVRRRATGRAAVAQLRQLASERPRFGYRRLHAMLRRDPRWATLNRKRLQRLYRQEGLAVRRKTRKKLRQVRPPPVAPPTRPNERWAIDFVHDYLATGRRIRSLNLIDTCTRECLAIEVDFSLPGSRVCRVLDDAVWQYGLPRAITVDNGPEFISSALDAWARRHGVALHFIQPSKPTQTAFVESFNGRYRDEFLSQGRWDTLARARFENARYRDDYNGVRPHSALGYQTPAAFAAVARASLRDPAGASERSTRQRPRRQPGPRPTGQRDDHDSDPRSRRPHVIAGSKTGVSSVHLCLMLGLRVRHWRKRAPHAEIDLIAERLTGLAYQRWMVQVKNTGGPLDADRSTARSALPAGLA